MINQIEDQKAPMNKRKRNVFLWIGLNLTKKLDSKVLFSDIFLRYLKACRDQGTIPCSKKKFSIYIREFFHVELDCEAITIENRGGIKIYGICLKELTIH